MGRARPRLVCVGEIASAHGVRGQLKLRCFTAHPESILAYGPLLDEQGRELLRARIVGRWKSGVIVEAEGIGDRTAAELLRGRKLYVPRERLPALEEDEFYHVDLIGLEAVGPGGEPLGRVLAVQDFGAGELLEIGAERGHSFMVRFTRETVPEIDLEHGRITVRPPPEAAPTPRRARRSRSRETAS